MKKIINFSVHHPIAITMFFILILVMGFVCYQNIPVNFLPEFGYPRLSIITVYENASPDEIDEQITAPLEEIISTTEGLIDIKSSSLSEVSIINLNFNWGTDLSYTSLALREMLDNNCYFLPEGASTPTIAHIDPSEAPIIYLAITNNEEDSIVPIQNLVTNHLKNRLKQVDGVAQIEVIGTLEREIIIKLDTQKVNSLGISLNTIHQAINDANVEISNGSIHDEHYNYMVKINSEFQSIKDIGEIVVYHDSNTIIHLKEIATITDGFKNKTNSTTLTVKDKNVFNKKSLGLLIRKEPSANTVKIANALKKVVNDIKKEYPSIDIFTIEDQSIFISTSINNVLQSILLGGILAFIVLFVFLNDFRSPIAIAIVIPLSIFTTFIIMYFFKLSFNIISLSGLALGIGMLVDNSIIVSENIWRYKLKLKDNKKAAIKGTSEVALAISASTLTTLAVFIPLIFIQGITSSIFKEQALTVTFSLLASLAVSLTLLPMISGLGKKYSEPKINKRFDKITKQYIRILKKALKHKFTLLSAFAIIFALSIMLVNSLDKSFFPETKQNTFSIIISNPPGTPVKTTKNIINNIKHFLDKDKNIEDYFITLGKTSEDKLSYYLDNTNNEHLAEIKINLADDHYDNEYIIKYSSLLKNITANIRFNKGNNFFNEIIEEGSNSLKLVFQQVNFDYNSYNQILNNIKSNDNYYDVKTNFESSLPCVNIKLKRDYCSLYNISINEITSFLNMHINGLKIGNYKEYNKNYDIILSSKNENSLRYLMTLVYKKDNTLIPISNLVEIKQDFVQEELNRYNQNKIYTISFKFKNELKSVLKNISTLKNDFTIEGINTIIDSTLDSVKLAILLSIILIYVILASQFESFRLPFIIMFVVPMGLIGVAISLFLGKCSLNIMSSLGMLILAGIIVNDAIVLIEFANQLKNSGLSKYEAIIKACSLRLRPIIMTTVTTILGLLPLAIGLGNGVEMQTPLAIAVIGGISCATFLTLFLIPILYIIIERK